MDIKKIFDLLDHNFLICTLEYGLGKNWNIWVKILLRDKKSCVINGDTFTKCIPLGTGARQGELISAFIFTLALEISFI